ncbi:MAG: diphthine--ammonia ligase [Chloroflexi bacterium]|nr:MAG: diphthine--ammonia ligase [Chloroflexota bacterium]
MRVAASWSGGKDGCLSCYKALRQGHDVAYLVNFISSEYRRVSFHGVRARIIRRQAEAVGIPLVQYSIPPDMATYEKKFKQAVSSVKRKGVEGMVFGDIYINEHREWIERVCGELGIVPLLPLWGISPTVVLGEFIEAGFKALVVSASASIFDQHWLGRTLDQHCLAELQALDQQGRCDVCGEQGEYHTLVVDGPIFRRRVQLLAGARVERDGRWFLDFARCWLKPK